MPDILFKEESYLIIGKCMEIHRTLGMGFKEAVYKDAMELEFADAVIPFNREQRYNIHYKGISLRHSYIADFVVFDSIILEVKAASSIINQFTTQTINYLKASGLRLGIIINSGESSLKYKRVVF